MGRRGLWESYTQFSTASQNAWITPDMGSSEIADHRPQALNTGATRWQASHVDVFVFDDGALSGLGRNRPDGLAANAGLEDYLFSYTSGDALVDDRLEYNITIDFFGSATDWTPNLVEDFEAAADYLSTIITDDVADAVFRFGGRIDDLRIQARLADIDGSGGVLGQAGPTLLRPDGRLPSAGQMEFDIADAEDFDAEGLWDEIVLHEMMHVLGVGTIWRQLGLVDTYIDRNGTWRRWDDTIDLRFNGEAANEAFSAEFPEIFAESGGLGIAIETEGGPGTAGGHWDEETFGAELMSGFIDDSGNYVSDMTIASLEDLGYETVWDGAIA